MSGGSEKLGIAIQDLLRRLIRERLARKPGAHLVESQLEPLDLALSVAFRGPPADPRRFAATLTERIDELLDDAVLAAAAFRPGHAYCHRCKSVDCDHSRPPSCRHVCLGFAPTGVPRWEDFAQHCLDLRHPRIDELYRDPPALLAYVQGQDALDGEMLDVFRNPAYELLGQAVAGFFSVRSRAEEGRGVMALTFQVAAWRSRSGGARLALNLLGTTPAGENLERLWDQFGELPWHRAVRWAQSALQSVSGDSAAVRGRVEGVLNGLARRLVQQRRATSRRTRHAEQRHVSGERPTRKAIDDARAADATSLLVDERTGALVVLGERGRTHFFTVEGQLVSSVRYSRDAIARKIHHELWRRASDELRNAFFARLALLR
jgi:hypothetical protein